MSAHLIQMAEEGKLKPFVDFVVPLSSAKEALTAVADRRVRGKAVIQITENAKL